MEKIIKKLQLKKERITVLNGERMSNVKGGDMSIKYSEGPETYCLNEGKWICHEATITGYCKCKPTYYGQRCEYGDGFH